MRDERTDWLLGELNKAYRRARLGKTKTPQVVDFDKVAKTELLALAKEIHSRTYAPRPSTAFIVNKPVKREIFAADLINTVVVRERERLYGIRRLDHHIRSVRTRCVSFCGILSHLTTL